MSETRYLITGASRGIGLELVKQLSSQSSNHIIAATRKPVHFDAKNVDNIILDQSSSESVDGAAAKIKEIDVLIANAAIGNQELLLSTSTQRMQEYLENNILGVHRVVNAFIPALRAGKLKQIVLVSSGSGSNTIQIGAKFGFQGPYSVTKAANNMQAIQYHNELHEEGFTVVTLHPGWVATDMGSSIPGLDMSGALSVPKSASDIIKLVQGLKYEDSAKFFNHDGSILPW